MTMSLRYALAITASRIQKLPAWQGLACYCFHLLLQGDSTGKASIACSCIGYLLHILVRLQIPQMEEERVYKKCVWCRAATLYWRYSWRAWASGSLPRFQLYSCIWMWELEGTRVRTSRSDKIQHLQLRTDASERENLKVPELGLAVSGRSDKTSIWAAAGGGSSREDKLKPSVISSGINHQGDRLALKPCVSHACHLHLPCLHSIREKI